MRHFTEEEIEFVKKNLENEVPKDRFYKTVLKTNSRAFKRMCEEVGINYPTFYRRKVHHNPFADLSNPDVMYWLGWLATDGYISHKETRVTLDLSIRDIDVIEKFQQFVSPKLTIHYSIHHKKFEMVFISFRNKEITNYLYELGFKENKTFTFVPNFEITWDYIRGVFEGDGYLRRKEVNITGASKLHIEAICNFVKSCGIRCAIRTKTTPQGTTMYDFEINNKEGINQFLDNIYKDANTFMNRKYYNARAIRNGSWKDPKFGEPASGIPSQASDEEGVTTLQDPLTE